MSKTREHHYDVSLSWSGAAKGATEHYKSYSREFRVSAKGKAELTGSADPSFLGDSSLYNPEEMLVAALSSCHMLSYLALCALQGIAVLDYRDEAGGTMSETGGAGHFTEVVLRPRVTVAAGSDLDKARQLHEKAHEVCFIASSVNFPVRHEATIVEAA